MAFLQEFLSEVGRKRLNLDGRPAVGWTCIYVPLEILEAGGLLPYRVLPAPSREPADAFLDPNFCPMIKTSLGAAIHGAYSFLSGLILVNTCDGMRRLYDAWHYYSPIPFSFLLDLPRTISQASVSYFSQRLGNLLAEIEACFQTRITEDKLTGAIQEANKTRALLRELFAMQGRGDPAVGHSDILDILSMGWRIPRKDYNGALRNIIGRFGKEARRPPNNRKIMLSGSLLYGSSIARVIEELGGEVVASDLCTGGRIMDEVPVSGDPMVSLSEAYLGKPPCARMVNTEQRLEFIQREMEKSGAQGFVYFSLKFCDPYLYEAPAIRSAMESKGVPILFLEGEYTDRISGGMRTRIQAFMEMLEKNAA
ncbi:MAG: 2-hydroxyacyl-CoA dehydratase [Deltaproteobacteria bacterium]|nr:2-hydroxyacyl-CoA dehydratase [Deltaproteobacteria bacterium]MBW2137554.1 2-hydroxyacyl-CoA dehydratase [Deltaproteobacteria bacterium]